MFCTVLHKLKSPENVGMIIRSHVAFGGDKVVFVGHELPWRFKKGTQAFSRKLEKICELVYLREDNELFDWCQQNNLASVAIEISQNASDLRGFSFPQRTALIVGNEASGLTGEFLARCNAVVKIPQFGQVECLNVAVSASVTMYELNRMNLRANNITGSKYITEKYVRSKNYAEKGLGNNRYSK
ncbi:RNA methyltransferase [Myxococcota bacterium]|nr:RNA methyltransferase [Myxococcota bacterium]